MSWLVVGQPPSFHMLAQGLKKVNTQQQHTTDVQNSLVGSTTWFPNKMRPTEIQFGSMRRSDAK